MSPNKVLFFRKFKRMYVYYSCNYSIIMDDILSFMVKPLQLAIVIPVYNSAGWIVPTLEHILVALNTTHFDAEIIIVDDGSTDKSVGEISGYIKKHKGDKTPIRLIKQENSGRYLARKKGVLATEKDFILFIDSRVFIHKEALAYLESQLGTDPNQLWNGHVVIDKKGNLFARFWDAIVCIAWRRYFKKPTRTHYGLADFDYYPKGTGFFFVPKRWLIEAMDHFEENTNDVRFSSDDTLLIRYLVTKSDINLSPEFSCLYHGRSTLKKFLTHAYSRGQFFIDGFLRPGTRFFYPLIGVLILSVIALVGVIISAVAWPIVTACGVLLVALSAIVMIFIASVALGIVWQDALALALLSIPFTFVYLAGLWRGVIRKQG